MRWSRLVGSAGGLLIGACTLAVDLDELEGTPTDAAAGSAGVAGAGGSATCRAATGCVGCTSCSAYCACAKPFDVAKCTAECADGGGGMSGASGGNAGAAGADAGDADADAEGGVVCDPTPYLGKSCSAIGEATECEKCAATNCCVEIATCFSDAECAAFWHCYKTQCTADGGIECFQQCEPCAGDISMVFDISQCMQQKCLSC